MNNFKLIEEKVKKLMVECHECGSPYLISIMNEDDGDMINAIEGKGSNAIVMMGVFVQKMSSTLNAPIDDIVEHIKKTAKAAEELEKRENG